MPTDADNKHKLIAISCGVYKAEIMTLQKRYWPDLSVQFLNSMLHMKPDKLADRLDIQLKGENTKTQKTLLIYGDCCMQMTNLSQRPGVVRVRGNNCCQQMLGNDKYRQLSHEGAFFLFPEWARRWRYIFKTELGLNPTNAKSLMEEMHTKLVYIDTGVLPLPTDALNACSQYCGLPWEVLPVSLESLRKRIQDAMDELNSKDSA